MNNDNLCTEDQANKKWCPMVKDDTVVYGRCIASQCMMWRLGNTIIDYNKGNPKRHPDSDKGYCGLANP